MKTATETYVLIWIISYGVFTILALISEHMAFNGIEYIACFNYQSIVNMAIVFGFLTIWYAMKIVMQYYVQKRKNK